MARIRTIKPEFPQSESIGKLSRDARLLFIMLWTVVDDDGRFRAASRMLASLLYPYDDDAPRLIDGWLAELESSNCICRYEIEGAHYLSIINWLKHQKIDRPSPSKIPPPPESLANARESSRIVATDLVPSTLDLVPRKEDTASAVTSPKVYFFESGVIRLSEEDFKKWEGAFTHLALRAELISLTEWAGDQPKWFYAVSGALAKRNREIEIRLKAKDQPKVAAFDRPWEEAIS